MGVRVLGLLVTFSCLGLILTGCSGLHGSETINSAAPSITTQPANQTVTAGQAATFTVAATGTAPLSYQWQKNGANISAATSSSYTTPPTTGSDDVADTWLQNNIDPLIKSSAFQQNGLLVITFDESFPTDTTNGGGHVAWVVVSPKAKAAYQSITLYQHESTLRLMLEGLGIQTFPGAGATAPTMWEFFTFPRPS